MPLHVDNTYDVVRTREELRHIGYSLDEINAVVDGYPDLDQRLFVPDVRTLETFTRTVMGYTVNVYILPGGHDATGSSYREQTIQAVNPDDFLLGKPDPDLPTGAEWELPWQGGKSEVHPAVRRAVRDRCRDFTQHMQPLVPGWQQLLGLRNEQGAPLGMPTGIGWYTHYGLLDMADATTFRLSKQKDDVEVLLYPRQSDNQSEAVWATPGGYVIKADTLLQGQGVTSLQEATRRRTEYWASRDVSGYAGMTPRVKYPISSGNTLSAGLRTRPYVRFVHDPNHDADPVVPKTLRASARAAGFVSLRSLLEHNPKGGVSGKGHEDNPYPIWTTHFEYVAAGLRALTEPEHLPFFRSASLEAGRKARMSSEQFEQVASIFEAYESEFTTLQSA